MPRPRVGVSACLLGAEVRFDGGHKRDEVIVGELAALLELVPVCPEVEVGMSTPRAPIHLRRTRAGELRLVAFPFEGREEEAGAEGRDYTAAMRAYARRRVAELADLDLDGFVLKSRSPSCGLASVPIRGEDGPTSPAGRGMFAAVLTELLPDLPVCEEVELAEPQRRRAFVAQVILHASRRG